MAKTYQCTECGAQWSSPFAPMFCGGTKGCKSKSFVAVDDPTAPKASAPSNPFSSGNPFLQTPLQAPSKTPVPVAEVPSVPESVIVQEQKPVTATHTKSENLLWRFRPDGEARPARFCPVFDGGNRLFVSVSNILAMFDGDGLNTGTPSWTKSFGGLARHPVIGPDGNIRLHAADGRLYTVTPEGQDTMQPVAVGPPPGWSTPTIDRTGTAWLQLAQGGLTKVEPDGSVNRRPFFRTGQRLDCTGLLIDGIFYVGGESGCLLAVDLSADRGENRWENDDRVRTGWCINSALAAVDSTLIVSSRDDTLYGYSIHGDRLWAVPMPGQMLGSPIVDGEGNIFIGVGINRRSGNVGMLVCVDVQTHRIRWETPTPAPVESTSVLAEDGAVYFGDNDGNLFGVDRTGRICWSDKIDAAIRSPGILFGENRLGFGLDDGSFAVFRCPSSNMASTGWPKFRGNSQNNK